MFGSQKIPVYCHMGNFGCGEGGWTMALKIDGTKVHIFQLITNPVFIVCNARLKIFGCHVAVVTNR